MSNQFEVQEIRQRERELNEAGFINLEPLSKTLQGVVYKAVQKSTNTDVVIKVTSKILHSNSISIGNDKIQENILSESIILKKLTRNKSTPKSIVKFIDLLQSDINYYLVMEYGGRGLFDFIVRGHKLMSSGKISYSEWEKVIKIIFLQMIECIEYIHSKGVSHFDISLENFVISDVDIFVLKNGAKESKIEFDLNTIQIKLIDFGLAETFENNSFLSDKYCGKPNYQSPEIINKCKLFNSKSNDVWCLGIVLFMSLFGSCPWNIAKRDDILFHFVCISNKGNIIKLLKSWKKYNYNQNIIDLFQSIFQFEKERVSLNKIKNHSWLK